MRKFDFENDIKTSRDQTLSSLARHTGFNQETTKKLYESVLYKNAGDIQLTESFFNKRLFESDEFSNVDKIPKIVKENKSIYETIFKTGTKEEKAALIQNTLKILDNTKDSIAIIQFIIFVISSIGLFSFRKVLEITSKSIDFKKENLFESEYFGTLSELSKDDKVSLMESLQNILSKNNRRWGNNYHLDSVYSTIMETLKSETERLISGHQISAVNDELKYELFRQLFRGKLDPVYNNPDTLSGLIADKQCLLFDLMIYVNSFFEDNEQIIRMLDVNLSNRYSEAYLLLIKEIISSSEKSIFRPFFGDVKMLDLPDYKLIDFSLNEQYKNGNFESDSIVFVELMTKLEIRHGQYIIQNKSVIDALNLIKSFQNDFNLKIRKYINNYLTRAYNFVIATEKKAIMINNINTVQKNF